MMRLRFVFHSIHLVIVFLTLTAVGFSQSSPDFSIRLEPNDVSASPSDYINSTIHVSSIGEFSSEVQLELISVVPPASNYSWNFGPGARAVTPRPGLPASSPFAFRVAGSTDATYVVTIRGYTGGISHTASITVRYQAPKDTFKLSASARSVVLPSGFRPGSVEVIVTAEPIGHYDSHVDLTLTQTGPIVTFEKTRLVPWESTRITISKVDRSSYPAGSLSVQIKGTGTGGASSYLDINVHVIPDFQYATGDQRVLFVPLRVKGATQTITHEQMQPHIERAVEYYREVSYGQLRLQADVLETSYELSGTDMEYRLGRRSTPADALAAIDADVDLRNYKFCVFFLEGWTPPAFAAMFEGKTTNDGDVNFAAAYLPSSNPGLIVHEMGHMFYLPDLYDLNRQEFFFTYWDEMGEGAAQFSGWSRSKLGWLSPEHVVDVRAGDKRTITLSPISLSDDGTKLIRIPKAALPERQRPERPPFRPSFLPQRFFYLEARKRIGFDSSLPSDGVLLYSVDESMGSGAGPLRLVDRNPETKTLADGAFAPLPEDRSSFEDAANGLKISIFHRIDDQYDVEIEYLPPGKATLGVTMAGQGVATARTAGGGGATGAGYVQGSVTSGVAPYAVAVLKLEQNGVTVSEVGVPVSRPTTSARVFVDYRQTVTISGSTGPVDISTGFATVNPGNEPATLTITLRDLGGNPITSGAGILTKGAHTARFVDQLGEVFPGFSIPPSFATSTFFGTLELSSDQPLSVVALRLTTNQRGESLITTMPIVDTARPPLTSPIFFPQLADGGGYTTSVYLINPSASTQSGVLRSYNDDGLPLEIRMTNGASGSSFPYSIPPGGGNVFQTDAGANSKVGWIGLTPNAGQSAPVGVGLFEYSRDGVLITQSGIPGSSPTTRARIYVDMTEGHDTGLAVANPGNTTANVTLRAFASDGSAVMGSTQASVVLTGHGHSAKFARQYFPNLPVNFRGVIEISSNSPFAALTVRSLVNARGDFLLTTFPVADLTTPPVVPIIFPQVAEGGGYRTELILLGSGLPSTLSLNFSGDDGAPLPIGQ